MLGKKLYQKRSARLFFLIMYGLLGAAGIFFSVKTVQLNEKPSLSTGFMVVFGLGMFINTLLKARKPQVSIFQDFIELDQSRSKELVRYRNITAVSRPDKNRIIVTLREDNSRKDVSIWLKELETAEVEQLWDFLQQKGWKK